MKLKIFHLFFGLAFIGCTCLGQPSDYFVMFYNVENLFDTINDPATQDEEFLPGSEKKWNSERYFNKINNIARVIATIRPDGFPDLIGMCEVENKAVLQDLVNYRDISTANYKVILEDSRYYRGVDVALLYNAETFEYIEHKAIPIEFPDDKKSTTRDILYVRGKTPSGEELHVFVNHWSSRIGGKEQTEGKRMYQASVLKEAVDNVLAVDKNAAMIILGDFNDYPTDKSIVEGLKADVKPTAKSQLINLSNESMANGIGSYNYKDEWGILDQIIVSPSLLNATSGLVTCSTCAGIYNPEFITYKHIKTNQYRPNRTYVGSKYFGGFSDHFPVYLNLSFK